MKWIKAIFILLVLIFVPIPLLLVAGGMAAVIGIPVVLIGAFYLVYNIIKDNKKAKKEEELRNSEYEKRVEEIKQELANKSTEELMQIRNHEEQNFKSFNIPYVGLSIKGRESEHLVNVRNQERLIYERNMKHKAYMDACDMILNPQQSKIQNSVNNGKTKLKWSSKLAIIGLSIFVIITGINYFNFNGNVKSVEVTGIAIDAQNPDPNGRVNLNLIIKGNGNYFIRDGKIFKKEKWSTQNYSEEGETVYNLTAETGV